MLLSIQFLELEVCLKTKQKKIVFEKHHDKPVMTMTIRSARWSHRHAMPRHDKPQATPTTEEDHNVWLMRHPPSPSPPSHTTMPCRSEPRSWCLTHTLSASRGLPIRTSSQPSQQALLRAAPCSGGVAGRLAWSERGWGEFGVGEGFTKGP